ncbi:FecCD family ABC transporter permease [Sphingobacterium lactis]|uniref:Iron complex transport system permease protein n=1 Tax=Sphingobacterium lactis TaxID=797291 RepID=A0A1H5YQ04_9SPHI|nr:iron ABC transporter permease [Sphingobacterium lactis]SEG26094.1 iron complex transport system permease protein [Sphingobacterium lactis]
MNLKYKRLSIISLLLFLLCSCILSISAGAIEITLDSLWRIGWKQLFAEDLGGFTKQQESVLVAIRVPRVLLGACIGGTLSISGCAVQGMFRNPLAEPGLIGVSSGASLFAVMFIVLGGRFFHELTLLFGYYALSVAAFIGAFLTTFLLYKFSVRNGRTEISSLLLLGIAINALAIAFTGLFTYVATDEQLRNITFWSLGSLGGANWKSLLVILPFQALSIGGLICFGKALNALALGEAQADHLGINSKLINKLIIVLAAIGVGSSVAIAGIIGFLALLVPHLLRITISADHQFLLPGSALLGASFLVLPDLVARTIVIPAELPIGILTAFMGVPMFVIILLQHRKENRLL